MLSGVRGRPERRNDVLGCGTLALDGKGHVRSCSLALHVLRYGLRQLCAAQRGTEALLFALPATASRLAEQAAHARLAGIIGCRVRADSLQSVPPPSAPVVCTDGREKASTEFSVRGLRISKAGGRSSPAGFLQRSRICAALPDGARFRAATLPVRRRPSAYAPRRWGVR